MSNKKNKNDSLSSGSNIKNSLVALSIFILGLITLLSLFSLSGKFGVFLNNYLSLGFGWSRWLFPFLLMTFSIFLYKGRDFFFKKSKYIGLVIGFLSLSLMFHLFFSTEVLEGQIISIAKERAVNGLGGGFLGFYLSVFIKGIFGFWGGLLITLSMFLFSIILSFSFTLSDIIGSNSYLFKIFFKIFKVNKKIKKEDDEERDKSFLELKKDDEDYDNIKDKKGLSLNHDMESEESEDNIFFSKKEIGPIESKKKNKQEELKINWKAKKIKIDLPLDLLSAQVNKATSGDISSNTLVIQRTLENFGISVEMGEISVGPTVTQYTFKPSEGVKLSKITTLSNDLSLALAAYPIRIEAPIPGKSLVGIEVPNKTKATVGIREILEDKDFKNRPSNLMAVLGKDVSGKNVIYDIAKMPHLLVAGATNSGKSVCLNAIIIGLLYQNGPENLRFIMVDPKRVELPAYNSIPHLLTPVITDVNKTVNALRWCLNEMDRRYEILNQAGKKNIQSYNEVNSEKMPFIVFVIDELADLMISAAKDIEGSIIRLTQMSRAVGIHLILATQRPSVDVITGLIKANTPSRIAFSVASVIDSRTILDTSGAEKLLGKGDMLFSTAELSKPKRIQGAYLSDPEILSVVTYIKDKYGEADYLEGIIDRQKVEGMGGVGLDGNMGDEDELIEEAKEIVVSANKASTSLLQRRLRIGYSRAASILDMLEERGLVGPSNGSKPREILISKENYQNSLSGGVSSMPVHNRLESKAPGSYLYQEDETQLILEDEAGQIEDSEEDNKEDSDIKNSKIDIPNDIEDGFGKYSSK